MSEITEHEGFRVERDGAILIVTLDRPKANALDMATSVRLGEVFVAAEADPGVRVGDLHRRRRPVLLCRMGSWRSQRRRGVRRRFRRRRVRGFPGLPNRTKPVIAAVNGLAAGGGFEIAMSADLIVAAEHATFFLPEARLGILPDVGSIQLPRLLPAHIAREMLLTGRRMSAEEAARWGLVNQVVPGSELIAAARALATTVMEAAPLSIAAILDIGRTPPG